MIFKEQYEDFLQQWSFENAGKEIKLQEVFKTFYEAGQECILRNTRIFTDNNALNFNIIESCQNARDMMFQAWSSQYSDAKEIIEYLLNSLKDKGCDLAKSDSKTESYRIYKLAEWFIRKGNDLHD